MKNNRLIYEDDEKLPSGKDIETNSSTNEEPKKDISKEEQPEENKEETSKEAQKGENKEEQSEENKEETSKEEQSEENKEKQSEENKEEQSEEKSKNEEPILKKIVDILNKLNFVLDEKTDVWEKTIKDRFLVKVYGVGKKSGNKSISESIYNSTFYKIICEAKDGIPVKIEITDKKTGQTKAGKSIFNGDEKSIVKIIKQHIYDKFLRNKKNDNFKNVNELITSALNKLDDNELNAFEVFYGKKIENFLKQ